MERFFRLLMTKKIPLRPPYFPSGRGGGKKSLICISLVRTHKGGRGGVEDDVLSRYPSRRKALIRGAIK